MMEVSWLWMLWVYGPLNLNSMMESLGEDLSIDYSPDKSQLQIGQHNIYDTYNLDIHLTSSKQSIPHLSFIDCSICYLSYTSKQTFASTQKRWKQHLWKRSQPIDHTFWNKYCSLLAYICYIDIMMIFWDSPYHIQCKLTNGREECVTYSFAIYMHYLVCSLNMDSIEQLIRMKHIINNNRDCIQNVEYLEAYYLSKLKEFALNENSFLFIGFTIW